MTRTQTIESRDGSWQKVPVISEQELTYVSADVRKTADGRLLKLSGEIWVGGKLYGQVLIESVNIKGGKTDTKYAVGKWLVQA